MLGYETTKWANSPSTRSNSSTSSSPSLRAGRRWWGGELERGWKAKDSAVYLLTAVAAREWGTTLRDVMSKNVLVNVVLFFLEHVFQDLQAEAGSMHLILQVDMIRFLYIFSESVPAREIAALLRPAAARAPSQLGELRVLYIWGYHY